MKHSLISLSVSALVAAVLLPVSVGLSASLIAAAGLLALALGDYSREIKPLSAIPAVATHRSGLRLAV
jgi:hypothetical protein